MKSFFILLTIICAIKIITNSGVSRFLWLLGGILYLYDVVVVKPFSIHLILIYAFLLSMLKDRNILDKVWNYPLAKISFLLFIIHLLVGLMDERINIVSGINRPLTTFSETYLCFFLGYISIENYSDIRNLVRKLVWLLLPILLWGILTYMMQTNPYYDLITSTMSGHVGIWTGVQSRGFRVCSFLSNPIVYGAVMSVMWLILFVFWHSRNLFFKYIVYLLFLINILLSNSRTGIVTAILLSVLYFTSMYVGKFGKILKIGVACAFMALVINSITPLQNSLNYVYDIYTTGGESAGGSNMELKEGQLYASLALFFEKPWFGHGFGFFYEKYSTLDTESLAGMEGYIYELLIEQGAIMIVGIFIFILLFMWFCIKADCNKKYKCLSISLFVSLFFFVSATGRYGNVFEYFALMIGLVLRMMQGQTITRRYKRVLCLK